MSNKESIPENDAAQQYRINWEEIETVEQLKCIVDIMLFAQTRSRKGVYPEICIPEAYLEDLPALKPIVTKLEMNSENKE